MPHAVVASAVMAYVVIAYIAMASSLTAGAEDRAWTVAEPEFFLISIAGLRGD